MPTEKRLPGRPPKHPEDRKTQRVVLSLTRHQERVLDALVDWERKQQAGDLGPAVLTRQDLVEALIRDKYKHAVLAGMKPVPRVWDPSPKKWSPLPSKRKNKRGSN